MQRDIAKAMNEEAINEARQIERMRAEERNRQIFRMPKVKARSKRYCGKPLYERIKMGK